MISRALSVGLVSALCIGAWVGCGDGSSTGTLGSVGGYHSSSGGPATTTGDTGSSGGGSSGSSGGSSSSGSSSGGMAEAGPAGEAGPPPVTLEEALTQFAACMSYSDFTAQTSNGYSAADVAKNQTTQYGDCNACHNAGDGGFWASYGTVEGQDMTMVMFQETQQMPYILKWVTGTVDAEGTFKGLAPSNAIADQAVLASQCTQGTPCHPKFQLNPDVATAITTFVTTTITKWQNNQCTGSTDAGLEEGG